MSRIAKLQEFLALDPNDSFSRYAIGLEHAKEKNFAEAVRVLEELRVRDADYIPTYYMLASYYRELADPANARAIYEVGIERATAKRDLHALSELRGALEELEDEY